jgi:aminopeptidase N
MLRLASLLAIFCLAAVATAGEFAEARPAPRQYAPDRDAGFIHMSLDITPDFQQRTITGTVSYTFKPIAKPLPELELDAANMTVISVESSEKVRAWQATDDKLIVTFAGSIPADKEARVSIRYTAQPEKGLYFRTKALGYKASDTHLFTQGEAIDTRYWCPSPDSPNEKFTSEITCHVPDSMVVLSNGRLISREKDAAGLVAFHWSQEKPHANYLVFPRRGLFQKRRGQTPGYAAGPLRSSFRHRGGAKFLSRHQRHHGFF